MEHPDRDSTKPGRADARVYTVAGQEERGMLTWFEALRACEEWGQDPRDIETHGSAARQEGRKDDSGKVRIELFPPEALFAISDILTSGARKYDDRNWEHGMKWSRVFGATMRHLWAWWAGRGPTTRSFAFGDLDEETGKSHLWHAGCCIVFLITYEERGVGTDDRWMGQ